MREAVAADAGVAVESVRAKQRRRTRDRDDSEEEDSYTAKRDPGYSQAVRRACQQRLVQLIPVRRSSLMLTIAGFWTGWALLLFAHYYVHVRPALIGGLPPITALVHLRSTHGIAHWLGGQLWMLTALASLMIFQLRKHKLDDYRARYRVWGFLAVAALFSSLDASSSGLYLLGKSIDGWALREVGYSGWSVVLASYAALVGVLGLRLCSEIKSAPMSLTFWLCGLVSWAASALLGTGLMKTPWSATTTDMVVGGTWLGGILAVFLAAGIYLRHTYIQAQKRFMLRNRMLSQGKGWKLPRFARRRRDEDELDKPLVEREPSKASRKQVRDGDDDENRVVENARRDEGQSEARETTAKRSWLRLPRWKSDARLGDDYSDVSADRRKRDEGFEEPLSKKPGWFSKKKSPATEERTEDRSTMMRKTSSFQSDNQDRDDSSPDFEEEKPQRKSWWKRTAKPKSSEAKSARSERAVKSKGSESSDQKRRWFQRSSKSTSEDPKPDAKPKIKKAWGLLKTRSPDSNIPNASQTANSAAERPKRKLFGFLDSLKLKPPADGKAKSSPTPLTVKRTPLPSSSVAQRNEPPKNVQSYTEPNPTQNADDDEYDDDSTRNLSKADRKRLRRQQQENRRAA